MILSAVTERLTAAIGRRVRLIAVRGRRTAELKGIKQMARDIDLSHPEFSGTPNGRAGVVSDRLNEPDVSAEPAKATQAYLPIGPCCC